MRANPVRRLAAGATAAAVVLTATIGGAWAQSFRSSALNMPSATLAFPSGTLNFPSALIRTESAAEVEVILPADVLFDFDKAEIRAEAQGPLRELAQLLRDKAKRSITVIGHTDAVGNDGYNQKLSERRADAVKAWLVKREGITAPPIAASGRGAREPVARNRKPDGSDDPEGRQLNRRVTIVFRKS